MSTSRHQQCRGHLPANLITILAIVSSVFATMTGVPFGARGTVVGIHHQSNGQYIEVVFDAEILSGTTLSGKCSNHRGQTLSLISVVNLTKPVVLNPKIMQKEGGRV